MLQLSLNIGLVLCNLYNDYIYAIRMTKRYSTSILLFRLKMKLLFMTALF